MTDVIDPNYNPYADPANYGGVTNTATSAGTDFFSGLLGGVDNFLGGAGGQLLGAGLSIDALNDISRRGKDFQSQALALGERAQQDTAFKPFSISTGFGGVQSGPQGGYTTTLSPQQQALQGQLAGITGGLTGGYGVGAPDVSGIQNQAFADASGFLTGAPTGQQGITDLTSNFLTQAPSMFTNAMGNMAGREQSVYDRIRATQMPEEQRQQSALNEQLAAQGRTGLRTAQFGGSPEQFAMEKARAEAMNQASLSSINQAGTEQERAFAQAQAFNQMGIGGSQALQGLQQRQQGLASGLFGLGTQAAGLGTGLQQGQLGNLQASMGLQYMPENQLLASLTPALSLADLASVGQRQGAGYLAEAGATGLEANLAAQKTRAEGLAGLYSSLLGAQGNVASSGAGAAGNTTSGLLSSILGNLF
tara:strand:- start:5 stop:1264 length:1260 start_codon:yes stop_codon:yes gene_type:complete